MSEVATEAPTSTLDIIGQQEGIAPVEVAKDEAPTEQPPMEDRPSPEQQVEAQDNPEAQEAPEENQEGEAVTEAPEGLDVTKYSNEYFESGEISEASYKELADQGIPKELVDTFMVGMQALQQQRGAQLHEAAGGQEAYDGLVAWGTANLPQEQIDAFNGAVDRAIQSGDMTGASMIIAGLKAQMGAAPQYVTANTESTGTSNGYRSTAEMVQAMRDPRYAKDPAYRADVENRLRLSSF